MIVSYDLHIHSALSPCADDDMTPVNIVAAASARGLQLIAVADHNAIANVSAVMEVGNMLEITVVPAIEVETSEEIHFLCLFRTITGLVNFYNSINFTKVKNRPEIFGNQYIVDSDDQIRGTEQRLLSASSFISETDISESAQKYGGVAVPAHIDRDANGIIAMLGVVPEGYSAVEFWKGASEEKIKKYSESHHLIIDSDAHTLIDIGTNRDVLNLKENSADALVSYLESRVNE